MEPGEQTIDSGAAAGHGAVDTLGGEQQRAADTGVAAEFEQDGT